MRWRCIFISPHIQNRTTRFAFLGSLSKLDVILGVELKNGGVVLLSPISFDINKFHREVESNLTQLTITESKKEPLKVVPNTIFALRSFWQAKAGDRTLLDTINKKRGGIVFEA